MTDISPERLSESKYSWILLGILAVIFAPTALVWLVQTLSVR